MSIERQALLKVLGALPEAAFSSLEENPTTRLDLELSIEHGDITALAALCYSAWLAEEKGQQLEEEHWRTLAHLADQADERETIEAYWPRWLEQPWPFVPHRRSVLLDDGVYAAMKEQGRSIIEVAQALRDAGASEAIAVRILCALFGLTLQDAITLFRPP
ncbi:MAG: hypothetical protein QM765_32005 [Myxococcales bacterium]